MGRYQALTKWNTQMIASNYLKMLNLKNVAQGIKRSNEMDLKKIKFKKISTINWS